MSISHSVSPASQHFQQEAPLLFMFVWHQKLGVHRSGMISRVVSYRFNCRSRPLSQERLWKNELWVACNTPLLSKALIAFGVMSKQNKTYKMSRKIQLFFFYHKKPASLLKQDENHPGFVFPGQFSLVSQEFNHTPSFGQMKPFKLFIIPGGSGMSAANSLPTRPVDVEIFHLDQSDDVISWWPHL